MVDPPGWLACRQARDQLYSDGPGNGEPSRAGTFLNHDHWLSLEVGWGLETVWPVLFIICAVSCTAQPSLERRLFALRLDPFYRNPRACRLQRLVT